MIFAKRALKKAALAAQDEVKARISGAQRGVPTFFDNFLKNVLNSLFATERAHAWDIALRTPAGSPEEAAVQQLRWLDAFLTRQNQGRLVPYGARQKYRSSRPASDIGELDMIMSQGTRACLTWKGKPLFKTAFDFALVPMLLWEMKPRTVFEIGSGTGSSAQWMADTSREFGLETQIYSTDLHPVALSYDGVQFLSGDCNSPATLFPIERLKDAPHPWLVIEDAHVNVHDVLAHMDGFLLKGDYLVVEDSPGKLEVLDQFMQPRSKQYLVDTHYTDFFGRNATCAFDGILVKT